MTKQNPLHSAPESQRKFMYKGRALKIAILVLILWLIAVMLYQTHKPLPPFVSYESQEYSTNEVNFWTDLTYPTGDGSTVQHEGQILNRMLGIIDEAQQFIVIDLFLFNDYKHKGQHFPEVSAQMTQHLIAKKKAHPEMPIFFITDEVNTNYNSAPNPLLENMKQVGIQVVQTDVDPLRDSTPIYSAVWRTFFQWFGQQGTGWIPNLMASDGPDVTARSYLKLLNVKANHRKLVANEQTALISTGNVHDASAYHSNVALEVKGPIIGDILQTEQAVLDFSGGGQLPVYTPQAEPLVPSGKDSYRIKYLTEGKVYASVLNGIKQTKQGDSIHMGMFYLADRKILNSLLDASARGVNIQLLLDPNENAFGQEKIGIPNRPVAQELSDKSDGNIQIRWYHTTHEQFHTKLIYIAKVQGEHLIWGGSTNLTPRNLDDLNLENELWVAAPADSKLTRQVAAYFDKLWNNRGAEYSLELAAYEDHSTFWKDIVYRLQDILGFTTF
ncbi:phospholipase [Paenibacillus polymyxa]|uniref:Phospholipase n=1 Tax=Paenibacillus polymyxa TaxID=1406 RepID=A0A378Y6M4_PAEPO|nr:phospholipase D family protein [Paenibacillus polymyxa]MBE7898904.1 phospholipase D family protein [Paenibacillus polymyxa]MBG9763782.1 phospholipase [Paenibacillus polymyxa]MCC3259713.1 phospholipase D family protein [Paenibacillus polymyxa]QPK53097.1 phospholipase [Paenibacillus polymyxa]QPK58174.1 phospholipase [Paenibacillus polymyxa]